MINMLQDILDNMEVENRGKLDVSLLKNVEIYLERSQKEDIVFYRIHDGDKASKALEERLKQGCPGMLVFNTSPGIKIETPYTVISGKIFFDFQKEICNVLYPIDFDQKKIIGITGTNGKTSVCHFISEMLTCLGHPTLSVGTLGAVLKTSSRREVLDECGLTTPAYVYLRKLFFQYRDDFNFIVMELSSHGLAQERLADMKIDLGVWTNFTQDHLDYHKTMDNYFLDKSKIFHCLKPSSKVLIHKEQDEILERLDKVKLSRVMLFDHTEIPPFPAKAHPLLLKGFMLKNISAAFFSVKELLKMTVNQLDFLTPPPGRFNIVEKDQRVVVVDYAHTPDALENLISLAKEYFVGKKINVLFGCGGERDQAKRGRMGKVVQRHAHKIYLTSDNPRGEDPHEILNQVKPSLGEAQFVEDIDRKKMIKMAIEEMKPDEVLLVAGKGHECYQEICGVKYPFNDLETVKEYL